jgi:branched-chain amino acid transport system ATP-binding protein
MPAAQGLALENLGVRFGGLVALDDVSMTVPPGSVVGVIGPNGAGKTTLFNCVCGFVRPDAGTMRWDGAPWRPRPRRLTAAGIARTLQGIGLFAGLTVRENVMAGAWHDSRAGFVSALFGLPGSARDERRLRQLADAELAALDIGDVADALPGTLPHAVRKRVALARALIARPRLLMLDEPAGGLSEDDIDELATLIAGWRGGERSVMLVEHHMDLVMRVCDTIFVLDFGKVIACGTPAEIRDDEAVAEAYLGSEATRASGNPEAFESTPS